MIVAERCHVRCDACTRTSRSADSQSQALYMAGCDGWVTAPNGDHLCPDHANEYEQHPEEP